MARSVARLTVTLLTACATPPCPDADRTDIFAGGVLLAAAVEARVGEL